MILSSILDIHRSFVSDCSQITNSESDSLGYSSQSLPSSRQSLSPDLKDSTGSFFRENSSISDSKNILMTSAQQSSVVQPLLTDLYQISMAYAYWKSAKHQDIATFDLYFRKNRKPILFLFLADQSILIHRLSRLFSFRDRIHLVCWS